MPTGDGHQKQHGTNDRGRFIQTWIRITPAQMCYKGANKVHTLEKYMREYADTIQVHEP